MENTNTAPIMTNENVMDLLKIMRQHDAPAMKDFVSILNQVGAMEKQLEAAVNELAAMRQELAEAQRQNHPVKNTLQKAVITTQSQVLDLRDKLTTIKENIISGCKAAISAFKEKGITALDSVARFIKIKPMLETMRNGLDKNIASADKVIAKIEAVSAEYHEIGKHLKNMGRAMTGKEAIQEAKPAGMVAEAFEAPYKAERKILVSMKTSVESAIGGMARLEEKAAERKPSIKKTLDDLSEKVEREKAERSAPVRTRNAEHEL
jgi:predicted nuclease with TOPRIM domain